MLLPIFLSVERHGGWVAPRGDLKKAVTWHPSGVPKPAADEISKQSKYLDHFGGISSL